MVLLLTDVVLSQEDKAAAFKRYAELLTDKNVLVRKQAALALADYGTQAKAAVPALRLAL